MSLNRSVAKSLLMAASIGVIVPLHAASRPPRLAQAEDTPRRKPKREDTAPVVPGVHAIRKDGRFVALAVENNRFVLRFLDENRRQTDVAAARALVRWKAVGLVGEERSMLNVGDDKRALVGNQNVQRPYKFKAYVTLLDESGESIEQVIVEMGS